MLAAHTDMRQGHSNMRLHVTIGPVALRSNAVSWQEIPVLPSTSSMQGDLFYMYI